MSECHAPSRLQATISDEVDTRPPCDLPSLEDQLGEVIRSARDVAASAEELLRELALQQQMVRTGSADGPPLTLGKALGPLHSTRQRLVSALERLPLS